MANEPWDRDDWYIFTSRRWLYRLVVTAGYAGSLLLGYVWYL